MNPYAQPSIIAFSSLLILGLAAILQNRRDKLNQLLFVLCLDFALLTGAVGMFHLSTNEVQANFWNKWPYILGIPSYIFLIEYCLYISGRTQRLKESLFWVPIAVHRWIIYALMPVWLLILIFTDLILAPDSIIPRQVGNMVSDRFPQPRRFIVFICYYAKPSFSTGA